MAGAVQDGGTLQGIARTLLALALLAERAAGRSFPVRFLVLVLLGRAEAIARAYVAREIEDDGWCLDLSFLDEPLDMHYGAADAEILALRLQMLATVLGALADADGGSVGLRDGLSAGWAPCTLAPDVPLLLIVRFSDARRAPRPRDTS